MSYHAIVIRVMIASPSDVVDERRVVREVIDEWNAAHSDKRQIVLLSVGWDTNAAPAIGRPQAVINEQIGKDCDLLVAIFWNRLGSPTGGRPSGTVEEIEEHIEAGKPAMLYFSTAPVSPDSLDEAQLKAVREFRAKSKEHALVYEYASLSEFRQAFARQLARTINDRFVPRAHEGDTADDRAGEPASLSPEARELLMTAVTGEGTILCVDTTHGYFPKTGGRIFGKERSARSDAVWRRAVRELASEGLIEDRANDGKVYEITAAGFELADVLSRAATRPERRAERGTRPVTADDPRVMVKFNAISGAEVGRIYPFTLENESGVTATEIRVVEPANTYAPINLGPGRRDGGRRIPIEPGTKPPVRVQYKDPFGDSFETVFDPETGSVKISRLPDS